MYRILILALWFAIPAFAQSNPDNFLESKPAHAKAKKAKKDGTVEVAQPQAPAPDRIAAKPDADAFQKQLAAAAQGQKHLQAEIKTWVQEILDEDFIHAELKWTTIQAQVPADFHAEAEATQLYTLLKLNLHQTFFDQWVKSLASPAYAASLPEKALEKLVVAGFDSWLLKNAVMVSPRQQAQFDRLKGLESVALTLNAYNGSRHDKIAEEMLPHMPLANKFTPIIAQTVAYIRVKHNDLKGAAKILHDNFAPAVEASKDPELLAKLDINIARILYQSGQYEGAKSYYLKIPNRSSSYLAAREELSWAYLRLGDMSNLRGEVRAMAAFKDRFQPEVFLLRAVSDLKMCFFDGLDRDLADFMTTNSVWAKKIDQAIVAHTPPVPAEPDDFTALSLRAVKNLTAENAKLVELSTQTHLRAYRGEIEVNLADAKKRLSEESLRQWKNQRSALSEAIRKMRFVKVEYMSQVRQLSAGGEMDRSKLVASNTHSAPAAEVVKGEPDQLNFPATSEVWSDELFRLRSAAQTQCAKKSATR